MTMLNDDEHGGADDEESGGGAYGGDGDLTALLVAQDDGEAGAKGKIARVYQYGLRVPRSEDTSMKMVRDQMRLAHAYRCTLTEIERGRRAALREIDREHGDVAQKTALVAVASAEQEALVKTIKGYKQRGRTAKVPAELTQQLKVVRAAKREIQKALTAARAESRTDPALTAKKEQLQERVGELRRSARKHSGLYWGTYLLVEAAMDMVAKQPLYDGIEPNDPHFPRWTGEGSIGVQIQTGMTVEELFGSDLRARVDPVDPRAYLRETRRCDRRRLCRTALRIRVMSDEKKRPIWAVFPMVMHREIPKEASVKWLTVRVRKRGHVEVWTAQVTWVMSAKKLIPTHGRGAVAIDVGWRQFDDGIRVAMWESDAGETGELKLPTEQVEGLRYEETLRSIRDKNLTGALAALGAWKKTPGCVVPEWFVKATETLSAWRSQARLAGLVTRWRAARFPGDEAAYEQAEAWRIQDKHLWSWECGQREKSRGRRKETYRIFGATLAKRYETLVLEKFDLRGVSQRKRVEEVEQNETARSNRHLVAVSELRSALVLAFLGRGGSVKYVPAQNTTRICNPCGNVETFDAAAEISHTCSKCGQRWDQDENAAKNILARAALSQREHLEGEQPPGTARMGETVTKSLASESKEDKWSRKKREKAERQGGVSQSTS